MLSEIEVKINSEILCEFEGSHYIYIYICVCVCVMTTFKLAQNFAVNLYVYIEI